MQLVPDDRSADAAAPLALADLGLLEVVSLRKVVLGRHIGSCEVIEGGSHNLVGSRFGDGVDHRAGRAPELGVMLVGQHLYFLDRIIGDPRLTADVRPSEVVDVPGAVEHDVVGSRGLAVGQHGVVEEAGRWV